jgi:flavodoxin
MAEHVLVAYFLHSGNTQSIATLIHREVGGIIHEIKPEAPYPHSYNAVVAQAKKEIRAGYKPALQSALDHLESYDTIFVGSPNWCSTIAPPVTTFLTAYDLSGKIIVPFCTHGGGGLGRVERDIAKLCPQSTVLSSLGIYGSGSGNVQAKISGWLQTIGIAQQ